MTNSFHRMPRRMPGFAALSALLITVACPAAAGKTANEAADQRLGMALIGANVDSDGTPINSSGVNFHQKLGEGNYRVGFTRDIEGCIAVANSEGPGSTANVQASGGVAIDVRTFSAAGSAADIEFHLIVFCPR